MHQYKNNFDDNCHELSVLRWFRDKYVSLSDKFHYYKVAPLIVDGISKSKKRDDYYKYIYENIVKACVEAIERGDYDFAYSRYKRSIQLLENKFVAIKEFHRGVNVSNYDTEYNV